MAVAVITGHWAIDFLNGGFTFESGYSAIEARGPMMSERFGSGRTSTSDPQKAAGSPEYGQWCQQDTQVYSSSSRTSRSGGSWRTWFTS